MTTQVVAFKGFINRFFQVDFKIPGFSLIDFEDRHNVKADCYFQINVKKAKTKNSPEYDFIKSSNKPYLVCESNLFRKNCFSVHFPDKCYYRLGWNHFLRQGNFNNKNSPPDRWNYIKKLQNITIRDWRNNRDGYILIACQKSGDSTLNSLYEKYNSYEDWLKDTINLIKRHTDRKILIRPHLLGSKKINWQSLVDNRISLSTTWKDRTVYEGGAGLEFDMQSAYAVVGYNSNTLVESTCEGIPTFPLSDESIIWDISNRIENLENPNLDIDRTQWLYDAGYMIWNMHELNDGTAWNHLKGVYFE
jgi:hypothetical protein